MANHASELAIGSDVQAIDTLFFTNFGMSSEQFRRRLEAEFEQATPEEQAEFERLVDEANAVLPGMQTSVERMSANVAAMRTAIGEMTGSVAALDARVLGIEDHLGGPTAGKPLPFRGGVGVGSLNGHNALLSWSDPTPGPSPEGEGRE